MKRKVLPLFLAVLIVLTLAAGCSRKNNTDDVNNGQNQEQNGSGNNQSGSGNNNANNNDDDNKENLAEITMERISGFLGRTKNDLATLFTGGATMTDDGEMYRQKIYGADARVRAEYDKDNKIQRFYVYTDENGFTNSFRTELDKLYGTFDETKGWENKDFRVKVERKNGEVIMILERVDSSSGNTVSGQ
ncbi:MAG: hypothetical protein IKT90_05085 [Clostridia bacterium]|nr:hypothetical protein [Clostridia bacterium]